LNMCRKVVRNPTTRGRIILLIITNGRPKA
jgi:hypothetical protein